MERASAVKVTLNLKAIAYETVTIVHVPTTKSFSRAQIAKIAASIILERPAIRTDVTKAASVRQD